MGQPRSLNDVVRVPDLGRLHGQFIPSSEVEAFLVCGWLLVDDMATSSFASDEVLMLPPAAERGEVSRETATD